MIYVLYMNGDYYGSGTLSYVHELIISSTTFYPKDIVEFTIKLRKGAK